MIYYTIYLRKNDEIVASGSALQCAKQMGKTLNCFYSTLCRVNKGENKKYVIVKENMEEKDDEPDT